MYVQMMDLHATLTQCSEMLMCACCVVKIRQKDNTHMALALTNTIAYESEREREKMPVKSSMLFSHVVKKKREQLFRRRK